MFDIKTKQTLFVVLALVVVVVLFSSGDFIQITNNSGFALDFVDSPEKGTESAVASFLDGGVLIQDEVVGSGVEALPGSVVVINYIGYLEDGTVFDDFFEKESTVEFEVGAGKVIKGVEAGVLGMKVGGKRSIFIKPQFGYGEKEFGEIPASSNVIFDVVLVDVQS